MNKDFEDAELDKLLKEQYVREADLIEQALFSDEDIDSNEITDEEVNASYEKLMSRLKAEGLYTEGAADEATDDGAVDAPDDTQEEKVVSMPESGEGRRAGKRNYYKLGKVAAIAVTCVLGVFAASMTSEANRNYVIKKMNYFTGNDTRILVDNDGNNEVATKDEYQAIDKIEKALEVSVPEFYYRPKKFEFRDFEVDMSARFAFVEYEYDDNLVVMYISTQNKDKGSNNFSLHGRKIKTLIIENEDISVDIAEVKDKKDLESSYTAQWNKNDTFYQLSGKMQIDEFIKLIEEMKY